MEHTPKDPSRVAGWGVDVDPKNDPTYPMKHRTDGEHAGYSWQRPPQQPATVEGLRSHERPDLTTPVGAAPPPPGPRGAARARATALPPSRSCAPSSARPSPPRLARPHRPRDQAARSAALPSSTANP